MEYLRFLVYVVKPVSGVFVAATTTLEEGASVVVVKAVRRVRWSWLIA